MRLSLAFLLPLSTLASPLALRSVERYQGRVNTDSYVVKWKDNVAFLASDLPAGTSVTTNWNPEFFNGFAATFTPAALRAIRADPNVQSISEDGIMSTLYTTELNSTWGLSRISHRAAIAYTPGQNPAALVYEYQYDSVAGKGVDVYVVDTGVETKHSEFGFPSRATFGVTFGGYSPRDGNGHGTHCAATIGGLTFGVAKAANIIAVKVLSDYGSGSISDVISGLNWVAVTAPGTGRASVVSMSLGGSKSQPVDDAVTALVNTGISVVVAAGNNNADARNFSPGRTPAAITVGATGIEDSRAYFSNYGPVVDIWAPGVSITSAWKDNRTNTISGTSMATPHVAGLIANFISLNLTANALSVYALKDAIRGLDNDTVNLFAQNELAQ